MNNIESPIELNKYLKNIIITTNYNTALMIFNIILESDIEWCVIENHRYYKVATAYVNNISVQIVFYKNCFRYYICKENTIIYTDKIEIDYSDIQKIYVKQMYELFMELMDKVINKIFNTSYNDFV